jgi:hypothetical protein
MSSSTAGNDPDDTSTITAETTNENDRYRKKMFMLLRPKIIPRMRLLLEASALASAHNSFTQETALMAVVTNYLKKGTHFKVPVDKDAAMIGYEYCMEEVPKYQEIANNILQKYYSIRNNDGTNAVPDEIEPEPTKKSVRELISSFGIPPQDPGRESRTDSENRQRDTTTETGGENGQRDTTTGTDGENGQRDTTTDNGGTENSGNGDGNPAQNSRTTNRTTNGTDGAANRTENGAPPQGQQPQQNRQDTSENGSVQGTVAMSCTTENLN